MGTTKVVLVGGFLGAGKTTLLAEAALRLSDKGKRVGMVANDQAADLVDTEVLKATGCKVEEVAGGCFCCRFPDMIGAMERMVREAAVDVLIGEPVGSCTDLSATVMQPLKELHGHQFNVAPFSVLVDGNQVRVLARLRKAAGANDATRFPDNVLYIYEKQLEEADLIVLNKADKLSPAEQAELEASLSERFPGTPVLTMSAINGSGVDAWLEFVCRDLPAGQKITDVDYDTYAAGEAALGWMNASVQLHATSDTDWKGFAADLLNNIRDALRSQSAEIAHVKVFLTVGGGHVMGNVTSNDSPVTIRGEIATASRDAAVVINARAHAHPDQLRAATEVSLANAAGNRLDATITRMRSFFPGRPEPTYRYQEIV